MININEKNSIFLFIDFQEKLINMLKKDNCLKKAQILAQLANKLEIKTIVTEQYPTGLGFTNESIKSYLSENSKFFEKKSFSAITNIELEKELTKPNIFVFGIETHICVFQTVLDLINKNFNVFVIKDACASREKEEFKTSINLMEKEGAKIITTEMVVFEMLKTSSHPKFKEIQKLIK